MTRDYRLVRAFSARQLTMNLPLAVERRIRAWIHRINAELTRTGVALEQFDPHSDQDIAVALLTLSEYGLRVVEKADGVVYDEVTGDAMGYEEVAAYDRAPHEHPVPFTAYTWPG